MVWGYALNIFDAPHSEHCLLRIQHFPLTEITIIGAVVIVQINFLFNRDTNELQWQEVQLESAWLKTEKQIGGLLSSQYYDCLSYRGGSMILPLFLWFAFLSEHRCISLNDIWHALYGLLLLSCTHMCFYAEHMHPGRKWLNYCKM